MDDPDGREHHIGGGGGGGGLAADEGKADPGGATGSALHKRTYQACLPCRRRKVRCDLGSVDEPGDPPCLRCRREKKDCIFSETRRKRKADDEGGDLDPEFVARNKRSSTGLGASTGGDGFDGTNIGGIQVVDDGLEDNSRTLTPVGADGEEGALPKDAQNKNREVANDTAAALFRQPITQPGDALRMLFDAASHTEAEGRKNSLQRTSSYDASSQLPAPRARTASSGAAARVLQKRDAEQTAIDPLIGTLQDKASAMEGTQDPPDLIAALRVWSTLRFVQAGWFTAREAVGYIDYFYEHLAPLTPISPPDFRSYDTHAILLAEEPMLVVTMMTIVSRYKSLSGPGGNIRTLRIHDKLWEYLQGMITRMFWGQEQFGGGFCGAGAMKMAGDPEVRRRGLRSLGTVESLLLLSDWMPRSMHFPPGDDANELTVPVAGPETEFFEEQPNSHSGWTEPAIRSDRMVWSLVGMAYTLSWELGVFDSIVECGRWNPGPQEKTSYDPERADRIGRMLLVYVSQACGRLGYPNMMPGQGKGNATDFNFLKMDVPPGTYPAPYKTITIEDRMQRAWAELTALMRQSNTEMFESKRRTYESIQNGEYIHFLEAWGPKLREWKARFDQSDIAPKARTILCIEYEYTRTYINSLALQAVVELGTTGNDNPSPAAADSAHTPPALLPSKLVDVYKRNRPYIDELVDAARSVLRIAVSELLPSGALRHSPIRTHFRVLSAAMFLLKSFALGAKESEVQTSMALLDRTIMALRKSVIDDVHLSLRIAELLHGLTSTIRKKFVRLAVPSRGKRGAQTARPSTSAPKTSAAGTRGSPNERKASLAGRSGQGPRPGSSHQLPQQNGAAAAAYSPTTGFPTGTSDDFYSMLGVDLAPNFVDLKDSSISIMPPPDFLGQLNADFYPPLSPHSSGGAGTGGEHASPASLASPTAGATTRKASAQRTNSMGQTQAQQAAFSPSAGNTSMPPFSPMSTTSTGGYDWLTLDFNGLLQQGSGMHYGGGHSPNPHQHGFKNDLGGAQEGDEDGENKDQNASNAWTSGAFGPEISEGLEMLGALGALGFDEGLGNGGMGSNNGW